MNTFLLIFLGVVIGILLHTLIQGNFKRDWVKVYATWVEYDVFDVYQGYKLLNTTKQKTHYCVLYYSKSRNKTKIESEGYTPIDLQSCPAYQRCIEQEIIFWKNKIK